MSTSCRVCGAADSEPHFGGITCRACAAFFRRYFHSKKSGISCTCETRFQNSHPCRECRIQKCLDAGMNPEKVQHKREKHLQKAPKQQNDMEVIEVTSSSSSGSQSPSSHSFILIPFQITSRDKSNISRVVSRWADVQGKRSMLYGKRLDEVTYYETCLATKNDVEIMLSVIEMIFPQLIELSTWDKNSLLRNFYPKWALLVAAIDFERNRAVFEGYCTTIVDYYGMVIKFYSQSMYDNCQIEPNEILRIFEPYHRYYAFDLALPICGKDFNAVEYMAVALMAFFDGAHTNISSECADLCHNVKNIVLRELRGYYADRNVEEMRFIETIDVLQLMQKGESKFQEELLVCEMNNVHIHDDYRLMIREHNY
ncbi:hypothetical protein CRE_08639 [Caenorhabditis remanei]|uniref:Nuclear receptor domain-containing protein n=1 Tax=Caenorhabditis remanei TaxID=31234 RepID=E3LIZ4_CAERE|nr:hypothetical protein CRE_08639 [Caenorhabditis remanei]